jgi:hypothetical protein
MLFTIQPDLLIKLVQLVSESAQTAKSRNSTISLIACNDRLRVKYGKSAAESEATIIGDGQCALPLRNLLRTLMTYRNENNITIQADERRLCVGQTRLHVLNYSPFVPALEDFQVFMASEVGCFPSSADCA